MNRETFLEELVKAFPDPGCPPEWLPKCSCLECRELADYLRARRFWQDFSAEDTFAAHTTSLMDRSFEYYLPAYMAAALSDPETADVAVDYSAWEFLSAPPRRKPNKDLFRKFTPEQQLLILQWLEWYAKDASVDEEQEACYRLQIQDLREAAEESGR
jgi:hypothetical protein